MAFKRVLKTPESLKSYDVTGTLQKIIRQNGFDIVVRNRDRDHNNDVEEREPEDVSVSVVNNNDRVLPVVAADANTTGVSMVAAAEGSATTNNSNNDAAAQDNGHDNEEEERSSDSGAIKETSTTGTPVAAAATTAASGFSTTPSISNPPQDTGSRTANTNIASSSANWKTTGEENYDEFTVDAVLPQVGESVWQQPQLNVPTSFVKPSSKTKKQALQRKQRCRKRGRYNQHNITKYYYPQFTTSFMTNGMINPTLSARGGFLSNLFHANNVDDQTLDYDGWDYGDDGWDNGGGEIEHDVEYGTNKGEHQATSTGMKAPVAVETATAISIDDNISSCATPVTTNVGATAGTVPYTTPKSKMDDANTEDAAFNGKHTISHPKMSPNVLFQERQTQKLAPCNICSKPLMKGASDTLYVEYDGREHLFCATTCGTNIVKALHDTKIELAPQEDRDTGVAIQSVGFPLTSSLDNQEDGSFVDVGGDGVDRSPTPVTASTAEANTTLVGSKRAGSPLVSLLAKKQKTACGNGGVITTTTATSTTSLQQEGEHIVQQTSHRYPTRRNTRKKTVNAVTSVQDEPPSNRDDQNVSSRRREEEPRCEDEVDHDEHNKEQRNDKNSDDEASDADVSNTNINMDDTSNVPSSSDTPIHVIDQILHAIRTEGIEKINVDDYNLRESKKAEQVPIGPKDHGDKELLYNKEEEHKRQHITTRIKSETSEGSRQLNITLSELVPFYKKLPADNQERQCKKKAFVLQVVHYFRHVRGLKFLKLHEKTVWYEMGDEAAYQKVILKLNSLHREAEKKNVTNK